MSEAPKEVWCNPYLGYDYVEDWLDGSWSSKDRGGVKYVRADRIEELTAERDEALNQLDSARHSVDVLEKRVAFVENERRKTFQALLKVTKIHDEVDAKLSKSEALLAKAVRLISEKPILATYEDDVQWQKYVIAELTSSEAANGEHRSRCDLEAKGGKDE